MNKRTSSLPSLADVAAAANVSKGTASHVLNGNSNARIARATQARVHLAAEQLGYRPNPYARSLFGKRTRTLGLMMNTFANPFFAAVAQAAWQRAAANGYDVLLDAQLSSTQPYRDFSRIAPWPLDGLLLWGETVQDIEWIVGKNVHDLPAVYLGWANHDDVDAVTFDFHAGMRLIMDHLWAKGYRKPSMVVPTAAGPESQETDPRFHAFHDFCAEYKLAESIIKLPADQPTVSSSFQAGLNLAAMPASHRPDVAVCYNDQTAIGVYNGLRRAGLRVPQDMAVTGFDGINEGQCSALPITTAVIPIDLACGSAIEMLIHRIEQESNGSPNRMTLPIRLLTGATT